MNYALMLFSLGTAIMVAVATLYLLRQREQLQRHIHGLEVQLSTFTEASIAVARTLDGHLLHPRELGATHCSRRYLLNSARERLKQGVPVAVVAVEMDLTRDETQLLRSRQHSSQQQQAA